MECPKCQARMEVVRFEATEVDRCVRCGGLWFDRLEHDLLKRRAGAEAIDTGPTWQAAMHDAQQRVFCPVDGALMARMVDAGQLPIWVENCPACGGTFLDAGEFSDLKEHALAELLKHQESERDR